MSLNKAIEHNKEHRKQYIGEKLTNKTCRNHGRDVETNKNRKYKEKKKEITEE